jgi:hypothetical protein
MRLECPCVLGLPEKEQQNETYALYIIILFHFSFFRFGLMHLVCRRPKQFLLNYYLLNNNSIIGFVMQVLNDAGGNSGFALAGKRATKMLHIDRQMSERGALGFYNTGCW